MAAHSITVSLPEVQLGKVDAEFTIRLDKEIVGVLKVSKGSIDWSPQNKHTSKPYQLSWVKFDELMQKHGTKKAKK